MISTLNDNKKEISLLNGQVEELTFEELFERCKPFIIKISYKWHALPVHKTELIQCCNVGLWKAYKAYVMTNNNSFLTFADKCMTNEILNLHRIRRRDRYEIEIYSEDLKSNANYEIEVQNNLEDQYLIKEILDIVSNLPKIEKEIIYQSMGYYKMTQTELGKKYNMSQVKIARLKKSIIEKIRYIYINGGSINE